MYVQQFPSSEGPEKNFLLCCRVERLCVETNKCLTTLERTPRCCHSSVDVVVYVHEGLLGQTFLVPRMCTVASVFRGDRKRVSCDRKRVSCARCYVYHSSVDIVVCRYECLLGHILLVPRAAISWHVRTRRVPMRQKRLCLHFCRR